MPTASEGHRIAFPGDYLPRKCGMATFTAELIYTVKLWPVGKFRPLGLALEIRGRAVGAEARPLNLWVARDRAGRVRQHELRPQAA